MPSRYALLLTVLAAATAHAGCPPQPPRVLLERFVAAPCVACWKELPPLLQEHRDAWVLDWIVPPPPNTPPPATPRLAFLRGAALPEAAVRMARLDSLANNEAFTLSHPLPQRSALDLLVDHTRLASGKIEMRMAARFTSQRPLPAGLHGWLALVERLPAGDEESPVDRQVVRAVIGPLPMDGLGRHPLAHLRTVALPAQGNPEQFASLGWVETTRGRVIAVGRGPVPDCPAD